jgi:hypothetical protein
MQSTICRKILLSAAVFLLFAGGLTFAFRPVSAPVSAAMDSYLVLIQTHRGQIKGESKFPGHEGWIEAERASLGNLDLTEENHDVLRKVTSETGPDKATINSLTITKSVDSASPNLIEAAKHGGRVDSIVVECVSGNHITHTLTITDGTLSVKPAGPGKEAIIVVGGRVAYN